MHLSRQARRVLGETGAVARSVPNLSKASGEAARRVWASCKDKQVVVWLDNWFRKRFGTDPRQHDMCLNVSVLAVLHIDPIAMFPGHVSLNHMVQLIPTLAKQLAQYAARIVSGVALVNDDDLEVSWIRVPLDVHRTGMRSLQWTPFQLTEYSVGAQRELLLILVELEELQKQTRKALPLLVDMDIHYKTMKLMYGASLAEYNVAARFSLTPVLFGIYRWPNAHTLQKVSRLASIPVVWFRTLKKTLVLGLGVADATPRVRMGAWKRWVNPMARLQIRREGNPPRILSIVCVAGKRHARGGCQGGGTTQAAISGEAVCVTPAGWPQVEDPTGSKAVGTEGRADATRVTSNKQSETTAVVVART